LTTGADSLEFGEVLPAGTSGGAPWSAGIRSGAIIFLITAIVGQAIAWFDYLFLPGTERLTVSGVAKIGALYLASFSRIPLSVDLTMGGMSLPAEVSLSFGLVSLLLLVLLYRAGKRIANQAGGNAVTRMVRGLTVVPAYVGLTVVVSLVMTIRPLEVGDQVSIAPSLFGSLLLPLALSAVACGVGGLLSDRDALFRQWSAGRRLAGALVGGWRMLVYGMIFAVIGLAVLTVIRPDDSKLYFAGYRAATGDGGAVAVLHNTLLLPNEAVMVMAPSMGACDGIYGTMLDYELICYTKFPSDAPPQAPATSDPLSALAGSLPPLEAPPAVYLMFLLVPLLATILGGRSAARVSEAAGRGQGALNGALAGVVFGPLAGAAAWFAGISIGSGSGGGLGGLAMGGSVFVGAGAKGTVLFGLVWGVAGGAIGGAVGAMPTRAGDGDAESEDDEPDEADLGGGGPAPEDDPGFPGVAPDPA